MGIFGYFRALFDGRCFGRQKLIYRPGTVHHFEGHPCALRTCAAHYGNIMIKKIIAKDSFSEGVVISQRKRSVEGSEYYLSQ